MEFLLFSVHYLYNYYIVCALLSHAHHVTFPSCDCNTFPHFLCIVSPREKKKKRNINNNLAILPIHDTHALRFFLSFLQESRLSFEDMSNSSRIYLITTGPTANKWILHLYEWISNRCSLPRRTQESSRCQVKYPRPFTIPIWHDPRAHKV